MAGGSRRAQIWRGNTGGSPAKGHQRRERDWLPATSMCTAPRRKNMVLGQRNSYIEDGAIGEAWKGVSLECATKELRRVTAADSGYIGDGRRGGWENSRAPTPQQQKPTKPVGHRLGELIEVLKEWTRVATAINRS